MARSIYQKATTSVAHIVRDYITNGLATTKRHGFLFLSLTEFATTESKVTTTTYFFQYLKIPLHLIMIL